VLTSANADFSERRVERYLSVIWDGGATPVVVLSKADLARDRAALESGELGADRLASYEKLRREAAFQRRKEDPAEAARERARWKKIHERARQHTRRKRWEAE